VIQQLQADEWTILISSDFQIPPNAPGRVDNLEILHSLVVKLEAAVSPKNKAE
jgi:hypothetical protein